jgi:hypothetical protein
VPRRYEQLRSAPVWAQLQAGYDNLLKGSRVFRVRYAEHAMVRF